MQTKCLLLFGVLISLENPAGAAPPAAVPASAQPAVAAQAEATNAVLLSPQYINQLAEELRANHPALRALEARRQAADHATNAVRTWEDPMFTFGGVTTSPKGSKLSEDGDLLYGLEQKLPLFGKARAARAAAMTEAAVEAARQGYQVQVLRRDLAKALFRKALADRVVELTAEELTWLATMVSTAEEHYRTGTGSQFDVLRLQNEQARRRQQLYTEQTRREHEEVALNRLLNRQLQASWPPLRLPPAAAALVFAPKLEDYAARFEPKLRVLEREIRQAEATVASARKARLPDVSTGIGGRQYSGDGEFREGAFTVTLSLPWFNRASYRSDIARNEARLRATELDASDYRLAVREEVHQLIVRIDAARREALLYADDIQPRSRLALESAHAGWQANRGMLSDVLEGHRMLVDAHLMQARAVSEQYQMLSELILSCGLRDLEALEALGVLGLEPIPNR